MKKNDIEVGGIYAVAEQHHWTPSHWDSHRGQVAMKARVIEVGIGRRGSATRDGVLVEMLERMNGVYSRYEGRIIVSTREVRELWSEFEPRRKRWEDEQARTHQNAQRDALAVTKRITDALPEGFDVENVVPRPNRRGGYSNTTTIMHTRLANLLEAAAQNGREQAHG